MVRFGVFEADLRSYELRKNGAKVKIQELPFKALRLLLSRPNEVLSRDEFRAALWPEDVFVDFERGISTAINRLRDALGDSAANPRFVETVERRGYRWIAPLTVVSPAEDAPLGAARVEVATAALSTRKKISGWVLAAGLLAIAAAAILVFLVRPRAAQPPPPIHGVAVLPFANLSGDPTQDYLAEGISDELTTDLAHIASLRVVSRTSVEQYKTVKKALPLIADELHVDVIVEGSVRREGDTLWVNVQLLDAKNDRHIWADVLKRNFSSASSIQHELAAVIGHQVGVQLTPLEQQYFLGRHPVPSASYQAYLQGRYYWAQRSPEGLQKAEAFFQRSASLDPQNAAAFAGLADTYLLEGFYTSVPAHEANQHARAAADKALALDDQLAEAHLSRAYIRFVEDWDFPGAEQEFRRALQLNPNLATAYQWYAEMLSVLGRHEEAIARIRRAEELDPFAPIMHHEAGQILQNARDYDLALDEYRKAIATSDLPWPHYSSALAYRRKGNYVSALKELRAASALNPSYLDAAAMNAIERAYRTSGEKAMLEQWLAALKMYPHPAYSRALLYAALGQREPALQSLQEAYRAHDLDVLSVLCSPELDSLRSDDRFRAVVHDVHLQ